MSGCISVQMTANMNDCTCDVLQRKPLYDCVLIKNSKDILFVTDVV